MRITDDPHADFDRWDRQQQKAMDKLPNCSWCDAPITGDYLFDIDSELYCEDCLKDNFRKAVDDYVS